MTDEPDDKITEDAGGEDEPPGRIAGILVMIILVGVAVLVMKAIVTVAPYVAYFVAGILVTVGVQKGRARWGRRSDDDGAEAEAETPKGESVPETLHRLAAPHVFLADFADARGHSKETARAVLEALGIRVRRAVRNGDGTGVGVHKDDIPPLPRPASETPVGAVDQGQPTNQQGVRIERTDSGFVVYDLADRQRGEVSDR